MQRRGGCTVVRQGRSIALVVAFLIGCAVLLAVGCSGTPSETSKKEQEPTEATKKEQTRSPEATASEEEARCQGTRTFEKDGLRYTTNDLPYCPQGGPLEGTDEHDKLGGREGDDEIRGLGGRDDIFGGSGNDVIYGGPGDDLNLTGDDGDDVIYGGDGNDFIFETRDRGHNKIYCGEGKDTYSARKNDYVSSSCEKKVSLKPPTPGGKGIDYD